MFRKKRSERKNRLRNFLGVVRVFNLRYVIRDELKREASPLCLVRLASLHAFVDKPDTIAYKLSTGQLSRNAHIKIKSQMEHQYLTVAP